MKKLLVAICSQNAVSNDVEEIGTTISKRTCKTRKPVNEVIATSQATLDVSTLGTIGVSITNPQ